MAATTQIVAGVVFLLAQTTAYATPPRLTKCQSTAVIQVSIDGTTWADVSASTTGTDIIAPFVRCTGATNCQIMFKVY